MHRFIFMNTSFRMLYASSKAIGMGFLPPFGSYSVAKGCVNLSTPTIIVFYWIGGQKNNGKY